MQKGSPRCLRALSEKYNKDRCGAVNPVVAAVCVWPLVPLLDGVTAAVSAARVSERCARNACFLPGIPCVSP